jgi:hypothetical protein
MRASHMSFTVRRMTIAVAVIALNLTLIRQMATADSAPIEAIGVLLMGNVLDRLFVIESPRG